MRVEVTYFNKEKDYQESTLVWVDGDDKECRKITHHRVTTAEQAENVAKLIIEQRLMNL